MSIFLPQAEADALLRMEKHRTEERDYFLPDMGGGLVVPLISFDRKENFHLDIRRTRLNLKKGTFQSRARTTLVLARIDLGGSPHRNPDDEEISCPHIHLYREGYGDRWAYPVPANLFSDLTSHWETLMDFLRFCNVTQPPKFVRGLFS